jgi:hypothetical protein
MVYRMKWNMYIHVKWEMLNFKQVQLVVITVTRFPTAQ